MKKINYLVFMVLSALFAMASCTDIDKLSDNNQITTFNVVSHTPTTIEIAPTEVVGDTIHIPILYGKYHFPLRFYAKLTIDQNIDKVIGIDFNEEQCLESIDDVIKFHVMANSGLTRAYYIKAKVLPLNENNFISTHFVINAVAPKKIVGSTGLISARGDTLKIFSVDGGYPLTITPTFTLASGAEFHNFKNGETPLHFTTAGTVHKIKVVSKSGAAKVWNIKLISTPIVEGGAGAAQALATTNIEPREFAASIDRTGFTVDEHLVDNTKDLITLTIKEAPIKGRAANVTFPLDVNFKFSSYEGVELIDIDNDTTLRFNSYTHIHEFYMLDALTGVARHWKIKLEEWKGNRANVLSFNFDYTATNVKLTSNGAENTPSITLDKNSVEIYPDAGEIFITATNIAREYETGKAYLNNYELGNKKWNLTMKDFDIKLSSGAVLDIPNQLEWKSNYKGEVKFLVVLQAKHDNDCWVESRSFTVTSEDGSTEKEWNIKIRIPGTLLSNQCAIEAFSIERTIPNYTKFDTENAILINSDEHTITLKLIDDHDCYPMNIYPGYLLSQYASITTQSNNSEPLVFADPTSTQTVMVKAQDGTMSEPWTVKLSPPSKAVGADVEEFIVTGLTPSTFNISETRINKEAGEIKLLLNGTGVMPLKVDFSMVLSPSASSSIGTRGSIEINSIRTPKELIINAQNGSTKTWNITIDYRPALIGGDMDTWIVDNNKLNQPNKPWCTANNSSVKGTTFETRDAGKVAVLTSSALLGKFAAGSVFLGEFNFDMGIGLDDPISLTYFSIPFQSSAKILGISAEVAYTQGTGANNTPNGLEYGSVVIELVNHVNSSVPYQYHGLYPNGAGPKTAGRANTGVSVVNGEYFIGNKEGITHRNTAVNKVAPGVWTKIFVPLRYSSPNIIPTYTHLHIVFSSSAMGADFKGVVGSQMKVDNIKLIYE